MIHNVMQIGASTDPEQSQAHAFSIYLVQPLLATSLALLSYNWWCFYSILKYLSLSVTSLISVLKTHLFVDLEMLGIHLQFLLVTPTHTLLEWLWLWLAYWDTSGGFSIFVECYHQDVWFTLKL